MEHGCMYTMKSAVTPTSVRASASEWLTKGGSYGYDDRSRSKYGVSGMNSSSTNSSSFGIAASTESSTKRRINKSVSIMAVKRGGVGSPMRHCQPAKHDTASDCARERWFNRADESLARTMFLQ